MTKRVARRAAQLADVARAIEAAQIDGYSVNRLANLRRVAHNFPRRSRDPRISWDAHHAAGSPGMLDGIPSENQHAAPAAWRCWRRCAGPRRG
jgi:hypothetical protein